ncbi:MAG TPA: hypothetical protein VHV31_08365, partial [Nitrolancea sp.]|nr:hypothetical protein [Nitrolancea sp.]
MNSDQTAVLIIRRAYEGEDVVLTELVMRSVQQRWRYPAEFMEWHPEYIAISPHHVDSMITNVLEVGGQAIGVYVLRGEPPQMELSRMMIDPAMIGHG